MGGISRQARASRLLAVQRGGDRFKRLDASQSKLESASCIRISAVCDRMHEQKVSR